MSMLIIIRSAGWMQAFKRFCTAPRYSPEWCAALAEMQAGKSHNGPRDCTDIAREDAQMRHDEAPSA
jgi:hypothetical protein